MTRGLVSRAVVPAVVAMLAAAPTAQAQFGGLIKRAVAGKATEKVEDKVGPKAPPAAGEAFSATTLQQVIAGAQATNAVMQHQAELQQRRSAEQADFSTLQRQNDGTRNAYAQANQTIMSCRSASFNDSEHKRDAQMKARMTADPQNMARMQMIAMKYGKAISEAQERGDTAGVARAQLAMQNEIMGTNIFAAAKADTAAADAKCGKLPKKPASLIAEDQKRATVAALDDSIRTAEAQAVTAGANASGMDKVRYLELRERLASIMSAVGGARLSVSYSDAEMDLVRQHQAELDPLRRAIGAPTRQTRTR